MTPARPAPDVPISHHLPEGKQTGSRRIPPRAARHCSQAKADAASPRRSPRRAAPLLRAPSRWLRVPGGGGRAGKAARRRRAGALARSLTRSLGVGAPRRLRPLRRAPGADPPPSFPGWGGPALLAAASEPKGPISFPHRLVVPAARPEARAARSGARARPPRARVGERARGQGGRRLGPGGRTYSGHKFGDAGRRNRFFQDQPEMGNGEARAALRGVLARCLGPNCSGFQKFEPGVAFFFLSFFNAPVPPGWGAPFARLSARSDTKAGAGEGALFPAPQISPGPLPGPCRPLPAPRLLSTPERSLGLRRTPRGVSRTPGPCSV